MTLPAATAPIGLLSPTRQGFRMAALCLLLAPLAGMAADAARAPQKLLAANGKEVAAIKPPALFAASPPPGFELYLAPQDTSVDVYYGGRFLLVTRARYTSDTIELLDPGAVVASLPGVLSRQALVNHLSGELASNGGSVCRAPGQPEGCGRLEPDFIDVIFDERKFRVDVFVHPDMLAQPDPLALRYLPPPSADGVTLDQGLSAIYSGNSERDARWNLVGRTWVGYERDRAFSVWESTDDNALGVNQLAWQRDLTDHQLTVGLFETQSPLLRAMVRDPVAGFGFRRSLDTRLDVAELSAADITLFLASRSQVDILRDGRLLASGFYEAGNQRIDTSRLPPGAYSIVLRITDAAGNQRSLSRFFVKSTLVAPTGTPLWFIEGGSVYRRTRQDSLLPDEADAMLLRGGYQWRQAEELGLSAAGASSGDDTLLEFGAVHLADGFDIGGELYGTFNGDYGTGLNASTLLGATQLTLSAQENRIEPRDPLDDSYFLIPARTAYQEIGLVRELWRGTGSLNVYRSESSRGEEADGWSAGYTLPFSAGATSFITTTLDIGSNDGDDFIALGVEWRDVTPDWQRTLGATLAEDDAVNGRSSGVRGSIAWLDNARYIDDIRAELSADVDEDLQVLGGEVQHRSEFGEGRAQLQTVAGDNPNTGMSLTYSSNLMYAAGDWGWGGPDPGQGGIIIDLRSAPADSVIDIMVNGARQFTTRGGRRVALALPAYRTYLVSLADRSMTGFSSFEQRDSEVTLYPGTTALLAWTIERAVIVVARVVRMETSCDEAGNCATQAVPLENALLRLGKGVAFTEEGGFLQAEIAGNQTRITVEHDGATCEITLDPARVQNGVLRAATLECVPVAAPTPLPADDTAPVPGDAAAEVTG